MHVRRDIRLQVMMHVSNRLYHISIYINLLPEITGKLYLDPSCFKVGEGRHSPPDYQETGVRGLSEPGAADFADVQGWYTFLQFAAVAAIVVF